MSGKVTYDLKSIESCDACQADLDTFIAQKENCYTSKYLPWGLIIGKRQEQIDFARARLEQ